MSSWRTTVGIETLDVLDFEEFYKFINDVKSGYDTFEEIYYNDNYGTIEKFKEEIKEIYNLAIDEECFTSDDCFMNRTFCGELARYIKSKGGFEISGDSISGWDPQLIILTKDNKKFMKKFKEFKGE